MGELLTFDAAVHKAREARRQLSADEWRRVAEVFQEPQIKGESTAARDAEARLAHKVRSLGVDRTPFEAAQTDAERLMFAIAYLKFGGV